MICESVLVFGWCLFEDTIFGQLELAMWYLGCLTSLMDPFKVRGFDNETIVVFSLVESRLHSGEEPLDDPQRTRAFVSSIS